MLRIVMPSVTGVLWLAMLGVRALLMGVLAFLIARSFMREHARLAMVMAVLAAGFAGATYLASLSVSSYAGRADANATPEFRGTLPP